MKGRNTSDIVTSISIKYNGYRTVAVLLKQGFDQKHLVHGLHLKAPMTCQHISSSSFFRFCMMSSLQDLKIQVNLKPVLD